MPSGFTRVVRVPALERALPGVTARNLSTGVTGDCPAPCCFTYSSGHLVNDFRFTRDTVPPVRFAYAFAADTDLNVFVDPLAGVTLGMLRPPLSR